MIDDTTPIYSSRIFKIYLEYLGKHYPDIDIDSALAYAEMTRYEIEDPAHWFNQHQVDRFNKILVEKTGVQNISREAGRYATSSEGMGPLRQYALAILGPTSVYKLIRKVHAEMNHAVDLSAKRLRPNRVEIVSRPKPGVHEKPYQCENRAGMFESVGKLFGDNLANIEHPQCVHKGDSHCRYIITWEKNASLIWKQISEAFLVFAALIALGHFFLLPKATWLTLLSASAFIIMTCYWFAEHLSNKELARTIEEQGDVAKEHLDEINIRYNNALLVQELGQATSNIHDIDELIKTVVNLMQKRLYFDRGMIMLANKEKTRLLFAAGYGSTKEQEDILHQTEFTLDNPNSKGSFNIAFKEKKPILIDDISELKGSISEKSQKLADTVRASSLICVPIIYENESLGILTVDNINSKRSLTKSDMSLLMGVASQTALCIVNARSFQRLQENEKKYRELVENANSIILRMNTEGNITFFNEYAQRFFDYREEEILGRNIVGTVLPDKPLNKRGLQNLVRDLILDPERQVVNENKSMLKDGEPVWIAWTYKPIFDADHRVSEVLCIGNDISELKRAGREKKILEAQLQRAQKMEAIGTLAGGVAHDLNNILAALVSYPELLLMKIPEESPLRKPLLTIQKSGEKAATIVQDLLTLARRGVATTEVANLNDIVKDYFRSPEYEKLRLYHPGVQVRTDLENNLLNILGSPVHLSKTIMNLISNAAEAMPEGGSIRVATENKYVEKPIKGYVTVEPGEYAVLKVIDTGVGISSEDTERIFEPFYTKKVMGRSGTGLGMAVVWGTVQDHNGFIDVQSTVGKGTTFTIYFPITRHDLARDKMPVSMEDLMGNGESVLIIDDVEEQREIATSMLKTLGYSVCSVASGEEAVDYLKSNSPDLLVLDMIMDPGIDGLETYKKALEVRPKQKAIIVSGYSETDRLRETQRLGAGTYVKKPYLLEKIGIAVRTELDR